ncbi:SRPBCC family protein [Echinicola sp. CAU 1574]|uniref:SRPBCC family protein n=1 Tax=Echinicola arenosa TaxID=2774144 RepID=A0ABR9AQ59_9BACT|nr:SRPBCC family protein [Echinicola arenosa]MBD8490920.1 SRPBCC family protein [Echinicola arenosa]
MEKITVTTKVNAPVDTVWAYWTSPEHITKWNAASDDWHTPHASNDLREGGVFTSRMESKDGSMGFDFSGTYNKVEEGALLSYAMEDGREVEVIFTPEGNSTLVKETFDPEQTNPVEMQKGGWQAILDNFKKYVESKI